MSQPAERYFSGEYGVACVDWHEGDAAWKARHVAAILDTAGFTPRSIVDIGCGTGGVLEELADLLAQGTRLVGIEPAPQAVDLARRLRSERVEVVEGTAADANERFDLLLCLDVFEHVEDYFGLLRSLHLVADRAVFHIPLDMNAQHVARPTAIMDARRILGHLHYFSRETALATLAETGWIVQIERFTDSGLDAPNPSWKVRAARGPRRIAMMINKHAAVRLFGGSSLMVFAHHPSCM